MKPIRLQKNTKSGEESFFVRYAEIPHTYNHFHFHEEYELMYVIENCGTRFVGDSIHCFSNEDLVLVGPNIPHYWRSDEKYFKNDPSIKARVVLVQFLKNFMGDVFLELPEMFPIKDLLIRAERGIQIRGKDVRIIGEKLIALTSKRGRERLMSMIEILCLMGEAPEYKILASSGYCGKHKKMNNDKMSLVFDYIIRNFDKELRLSEIADLANMNPSAFCRYIKKTTFKTFSEVLNEIRIGFACKMLINTDKNISEIGYSCGFMNIPYFNRTFKQIKNVTPTYYREIHCNKI